MKITKNELKQMIREALHEANFAGRADLQMPVDKSVGTDAREAFEQTINDLVVELNRRFSAGRTGKNVFVQKPYLENDWTPEGVIKVIIEFTTTGSRECATLHYKDSIARWLREQPRVRQQGINVASRMTDDNNVFEYILSCNVGVSDEAPKGKVNQLVHELVKEELAQLRLLENGRGYSRDVWLITDMNQFLEALINNGNNKLRVRSIGELWEMAHSCKTCRYQHQCDVLYEETGERLGCTELMNIMIGENDVTG